MSQQALSEIIARSVADYGFRLAVIWGADDVAAGFQLTPPEARALTELIIPELKKLPNPVEPEVQTTVQERITARLR